MPHSLEPEAPLLIAAADVGGTNTRIGLVDVHAGPPPSASVLQHETSPTARSDSPAAAIARFVDEAGAAVDAVSVAVAGPVRDGAAALTNIGREITVGDLTERTGVARATLINDFRALGFALTVLGEGDLERVRDGAAPVADFTGREGPVALIGAGTGLGQAIVHPAPTLQDVHVDATEGGHVTFAARSRREWALRSWLAGRHAHVSWERILSGDGVRSVYDFLVSLQPHRESAETRAAMAEPDADPSRQIVRRGVSGSDPLCEEALELFVSAFGARAGDVALSTGAKGGVVLGGGIAPNLVGLLGSPTFADPFADKGRMSGWLSDVPVDVVTQPHAGVLGAAVAGLRSMLRD